MSELYYEEVLDHIDGIVLRSNVRLATPNEIKEAETLHKVGKCPHTIVIDDYGWLYDIRSCAICGRGLGTV